ncbi:MAG: hypothetical protein Q9162_005512 [Coniocarpon cinnabarinum]
MSHDANKKRKRWDESEKPRKKKSSEARDSNINITYVPHSEVPGFIVAIGGGLSDPAKVQFDAYSKSSTGSSATLAHNEVLLHSSDHPRLNFTARERPEGAPASHLKHYVGVLDPDTNELQLVEARHVTVRSTVKAEDDFMLAQQTEKEDAGAAGRRALGLEFGTKKARKAIAQSADNRVNSMGKKPGQKTSRADAVLEVLRQGAEDAPTKEDLEAETEAAKPRPKYNAMAKKSQDVYTVGDVIGEDLMQNLKVKPWWDAVRDDRDVQLRSLYVSKRLESLVEQDDIRKLKISKYVYVLIKFLDACTHRGKAIKSLPKRKELREKIDEPDNVLDKVIERFTANGKFTQWHVDLVRTTLAVLTLMIDDFETDTYDLREDIGLKAPDMNKYFAEVGAKVKPPTEEQKRRKKLSKAEAGAHGIATLKIPLEFPKARTIPSRR